MASQRPVPHNGAVHDVPARKLPSRPTNDPLTYEGHRAQRAWTLPTGVALIIGGFAASSFASLLPPLASSDSKVIAAGLDKLVAVMTKSVVQMNFSGVHALASLMLIGFVVAGILVLTTVNTRNQQFMAAHPYVQVSYSAAERAAAEVFRVRHVITGTVLCAVAAGIDLALLGTEASPIQVIDTLDSSTTITLSAGSEVLNGCLVLLVALGVWLIVRGEIVWATAHVFVYNYRALENQSIFEVDMGEVGERRTQLLALKRLRLWRSNVNRIIVSVGALIAACLFFLPTMETPFWWVALVIAAVACRVVSEVAIHRAEELHQKLEESR